jgi:hypothetical protein
MILLVVWMSVVRWLELKRYRYDSMLPAGCVAAGGTLGILIPPSLGFIIYGILTEQSIGKPFMAMTSISSDLQYVLRMKMRGRGEGRHVTDTLITRFNFFELYPSAMWCEMFFLDTQGLFHYTLSLEKQILITHLGSPL